MSVMSNYFLAMQEDAKEMELREFIDRYGDTTDNHNLWYEVNDVKE